MAKKVRKEILVKPIIGPTPGKKATIIVLIIIAVILMGSALAYFYIVPRAELEIQTVYHERLGGGSTGGGININILFTNTGTLKITSLSYTLTVINETNSILIRTSDTISILESGEDQEIASDFMGNHYHTYYIALHIEFACDDDDFSSDFSYKTVEDSMNLIYKDTIE